jgi:hypothetical protein
MAARPVSKNEKDELSQLSQQLGRFENSIEGHLPPVEKWTPELSGSMDMVIKSNGDWVHEGVVIKRHKLSRLFSSILIKEELDYFLVTPVEKWQVAVEDQPFLIVLAEVLDGGIKLLTNMGEELILSLDHPFLLDDHHEAPSVLVRKNLYARLSRPVFYQLADLATEQDGAFYLTSQGQQFQLG